MVLRFVETGDLWMPGKAKIGFKLTLIWIPNDNEILWEVFPTMNFRTKQHRCLRAKGLLHAISRISCNGISLLCLDWPRLVSMQKAFVLMKVTLDTFLTAFTTCSDADDHKHVKTHGSSEKGFRSWLYGKRSSCGISLFILKFDLKMVSLHKCWKQKCQVHTIWESGFNMNIKNNGWKIKRDILQSSETRVMNRELHAESMH